MTALNVVVDLSHHNNRVDFGRARADGIRGVIHKATQGAAYVDPHYLANRAKARAVGLWWGAYHFGSGGDGSTQARHFLEVVKPATDTLLALDFEPNSQGPSMTLDQARAFVTHVHQATGRWPGFYSGHYIKEWIGRERDAVLSQCWFWLTQYRPKPAVPPCWRTWTMWQYTDGGMGPEPHTVDGIGRCDRDKFNGALARLEALWGIRPPARVGRGRRAGARARRRKALESPRSA